MQVSIIVATYGEATWPLLAKHRALPSAQKQEAHEVISVHQSDWSIAQIRNYGAEQATGDWLCFLDADDELGFDYIGAMRRALEQERGVAETPLLLTPAVSYVVGRRVSPPKIAPRVPLESGNWLVIGTLLPRKLFFAVGGFIDRGDPPGSYGYEDWSLWTRCHKAEARVIGVPKAVYLAHVRKGSRNRSATSEQRLRWHYTIGRDIWPEHYPEGWMGIHDYC